MLNSSSPGERGQRGCLRVGSRRVGFRAYGKTPGARGAIVRLLATVRASGGALGGGIRYLYPDSNCFARRRGLRAVKRLRSAILSKTPEALATLTPRRHPRGRPCRQPRSERKAHVRRQPRAHRRGHREELRGGRDLLHQARPPFPQPHGYQGAHHRVAPRAVPRLFRAGDAVAFHEPQLLHRSDAYRH